MIRVDQAGEYGAARIYAGQLAVMGNRHPMAAEIGRMKVQEQRHLDTFNRLLAERGVRPTILSPLWDAAGFALGAATALMGPRAAMACTAAVETEIDAHYSAQLEALGDTDPELTAHIEDFQAEEQEHRETALAHGAADTPGYPVLSAVIRAGCRAAIAVAKRV
ncbi:demethoxyubiquinone hydroxylase family protein [Pacificimonas sp. WHA3]|uniref:3-demethoxyubiquinol 3-hydroxylase n=1 Tax=Pacificimonas pallii TaxID=2827236 RepID=A0ABS6SCA0_9SPHN|nr:demethoxyubiquinone hydroxylase family protein [Pacificimonas pallii]MBV7255985.1 demethoxyubiquinone hydroxylase family protein [Pacificimonas pallii]